MPLGRAKVPGTVQTSAVDGSEEQEENKSHIRAIQEQDERATPVQHQGNTRVPPWHVASTRLIPGLRHLRDSGTSRIQAGASNDVAADKYWPR
jgi:hypothetical protein